MEPPSRLSAHLTRLRVTGGESRAFSPPSTPPKIRRVGSRYGKDETVGCGHRKQELTGFTSVFPFHEQNISPEISGAAPLTSPPAHNSSFTSN